MRLKPQSRLRGLRSSVGEELLRLHRNYQPALAKLPEGMLHGLAHITGGGLIDNLPRVLPTDCDAAIETVSWQVPPIFQVLAEKGKVDRTEMYQVFNMGIGMVVIVADKDAEKARRLLKAKRIGQIVPGRGRTRLIW